MSIVEKKVRKYIRNIIEQDEKTRLKRDVINCSLLITMEQKAHVPDTLTKIRALPSVTVVGQDKPVQRSNIPGGVTRLEIYVKFLPNTSVSIDAINSVAKSIKGLTGVKSIKVISIGSREVVYKGKPIVI